MGFLDKVLPVVAGAAGTAVGGPLGGAVAGSLTGAALGGDKPVEMSSTLGAAPAAPSSNVLGNGGSSEAMPDIEPLEAASPKTFGERFKGGVGKFNNALGSDAGRLAQNVGGQFLGDFRQRRNTNNRYDDLQGRGLNAYEAAGISGSSVGAPSTSLGAAPSSKSGTLQRHERAIQEAGKEVPRGQLNRQQIMDYWSQEKIGNEIKKLQFELENFWPIKYASMGPENGLFALASWDKGINFEDILKGLHGSQDPEQVRALIDQYVDWKSFIGKERHGITQFIQWLGAKAGDTLPFAEKELALHGANWGQFGKDVLNPGGLPNAIRNSRKN